MIEARTENEEGLSAVAGALICLGVIIGVGAIIMLIVLMRLVNICSVMECCHILVVQCNTQTNSEAILQQCMYACGGSRPSYKEGGGGVIHTLRKVEGGLKKKSFRPFGPQFGPKIRGGLDPPLS